MVQFFFSYKYTLRKPQQPHHGLFFWTVSAGIGLVYIAEPQQEELYKDNVV